MPTGSVGIEVSTMAERHRAQPSRRLLSLCRTMALVCLLAVVLVALPLSYEHLVVIVGPIIAEVMIQVVGEILFLQVGFAVMGLVVVGLMAAG
jgi:multisubunit Na+/H+ antiporter MnhB subunit